MSMCLKSLYCISKTLHNLLSDLNHENPVFGVFLPGPEFFSCSAQLRINVFILDVKMAIIVSWHTV